MGLPKKKKPPDDGVEKIGQVTMDLSTAIEGIVNGIEWSQNQYIPTTLSQTVVEVMDAKSNQNKGCVAC